jgi:hypothetical protein
MKVYTVMIGRNYEGDALDSLWASFELAKARAMEILAEEDSYCNTANSEPYEPISEAPGSCAWLFKHGGGEVAVYEMAVGT